MTLWNACDAHRSAPLPIGSFFFFSDVRSSLVWSYLLDSTSLSCKYVTKHIIHIYSLHINKLKPKKKQFQYLKMVKLQICCGRKTQLVSNQVVTNPCSGLAVIFCSFISHLIGRETINIPEIFSGGFTGMTVTWSEFCGPVIKIFNVGCFKNICTSYRWKWIIAITHTSKFFTAHF